MIFLKMIVKTMKMKALILAGYKVKHAAA